MEAQKGDTVSSTVTKQPQKELANEHSFNEGVKKGEVR